MKIRPRNEHVVIRIIPAREQRSGIVIPGQEMERNLFAVVAVGQGGLTVEGKRMPIEIADGQPLLPDMLIFVRPGDYEQYEDGKEARLVVPQSSIIGVEVDDNDQPLFHKSSSLNLN
jgi:co-chaperonin GroES (HSP10)